MPLAAFRERFVSRWNYLPTSIACLVRAEISDGPTCVLLFGDSDHLPEAMAYMLAAGLHAKSLPNGPTSCFVAIEEGNAVLSGFDSRLPTQEIIAASKAFLRPWRELMPDLVQRWVDGFLRREYELVLEESDGYAHMLVKALRRAKIREVDTDWPPVKGRCVNGDWGSIMGWAQRFVDAMPSG
jgi:hypothetical protein